MASEFAATFAETSWPLMLEYFGEPATYSPKVAVAGTSPISLVAIIAREIIDATYDDDGRGETLTATIDVSTIDVPDPQRGDIATFDGKDWSVYSFDSSDGAGHTLLRVKRFEQEVISDGIVPIVRT